LHLLECCCWSMKFAISFLFVLLRDRTLVAECCYQTRLASFNLRLFQSYYCHSTSNIEKLLANRPLHLLECCCWSMKVAIRFLYVFLRDGTLVAECCCQTRVASFNLRLFQSYYCHVTRNLEKYLANRPLHLLGCWC
jgi:hypothetical protein